MLAYKNYLDNLVTTVSKAYWCENQVSIEGRHLTAGFTLREDVNGNLFYNLTADISKTSKGKAPHGLKPVARKPGHEELLQDDKSSVDKNINADTDHVNLKILSSEGKSAPRGSVRIFPESYLVSLFDKARLSSVLHATGHMFFEERGRMVDSGAAGQPAL